MHLVFPAELAALDTELGYHAERTYTVESAGGKQFCVQVFEYPETAVGRAAQAAGGGE